MWPNKRRKFNSGKYFSAELPTAAEKEVARNNLTLADEQQALAGLEVLAIETSASVAEEMPLVLVVKP